MNDDSAQSPEKVRQELAELRQSNSDLRQQRAVEQAADRIRQAVLAMRKSEDLEQVVEVMFREMRRLGIETPACSFQFVDEERDLVNALGASENPRKEGISWTSPHLKEIDEDLVVYAPEQQTIADFLANAGGKFADLIERWQVGKTWSIRQSAESTEQSMKRMAAVLGFDRLPPSLIREWVVTNVPFTYGTVGFRQGEYVEKHVGMVEDLTEALSLGYLRFLDFQRLEEQTRQAQVEAALERVRAAVASMQQSQDLNRIVELCGQMLQELGVPCDGVGINIIDEAAGEMQLHSTTDSNTLSLTLPLIAEIYAHWQAGKTLVRFRDPERIRRYFFERKEAAPPDLTDDEIEVKLKEFADRWIVDAPFSHGTLAMNRPGEQPFSDEDIQLVERFAQVLSLAYSRFLDFQQVEQQNRTLSLDAAVQQVRAEVLAMEQAEDLNRVAALVWQSLGALGVDIDGVLIGVVNEERGISIYRMVFANDEAALYPYPRVVRDIVAGATLLYPVLMEAEYFEENGVPNNERLLSPIGSLSPAELRGLQQAIKRNWGVDTPLDYLQRKAYLTVGLSRGMLIAVGQRNFTEDDMRTAEAFIEVIDLAYTRVVDFQRLEQQNRQARLEAAVQQVRAEATAMQQSRDVIQVMVALWQGLEEMVLLPEMCSLNIQDQEADVLRIYTAIKPSGAVTLADFSADKVLREDIVAGVHLLGSEIPLSFAYERRYATREVEARIHRLSDTTYQRLNQIYDAQLPPGTYAGHSVLGVPFGYGGIFVIGTESADFGREELAIGKAFAGAVTLGYTRFLDLQRLEDQNRDLEVALAEKERAQEALVRSESLAAIGTLAAGAAHELNNPIGAAASLVQTVEEMAQEDGDEEWLEDRPMVVEHLAFSRKELERAKDIVASLLDLSRQNQDYTEAVELQTVVQDALRGLQGRYDAERVTVEEAYQADLPTAQGNFAQLVQVALNLITNAVDALGEEAGRIALKTYAEADQVMLECRDSGAGMSDGVRQDIFKPFFTTKAPGEGTGLGLYVCHQIIDKHGGSIEVESGEGQGTTFRICLPIA